MGSVQGFLTPSLKLWLKMAEDMGLPEKDAVLLWAKEKLPERFRTLIQESPEPDLASMREKVEAAGRGKEEPRGIGTVPPSFRVRYAVALYWRPSSSSEAGPGVPSALPGASSRSPTRSPIRSRERRAILP